MLNLECIGGCGKVIINANVDETDIAGAICPDCGAAHADAKFGYSEEFAGWALLSQEVVDALKKV